LLIGEVRHACARVQHCDISAVVDREAGEVFAWLNVTERLSQ